MFPKRSLFFCQLLKTVTKKKCLLSKYRFKSKYLECCKTYLSFHCTVYFILTILKYATCNYWTNFLLNYTNRQEQNESIKMPKKSKVNKLARMSDEERARYLQHRADLEEETRRRKRELVTRFIKVRLQFMS